MIVQTRGNSGRARDEFDATARPAPTVTAVSGKDAWRVVELDRRTNSKVAGGGMGPTVRVPVGRPSPSVTGKAGGQWRWCFGRPATTVQATPRIAPPGHHEVQFKDSIKVELHELAALQDFPDAYPFQGNKTQKARQIGNAVPRSLARVIVERLVA